jgi:hypothetical protein
MGIGFENRGRGREIEGFEKRERLKKTETERRFWRSEK